MADVPVGAVPAPVTATVVQGNAPAPSKRAEKLAAVNVGLKKLAAEEGAAQPVEKTEAAPVVEKPADPVAGPAKEEAAPVVEKPEPEPADDKPDPKVAKALAQIDKQAKKFRDEQAAAKAELELERAELARIRAEVSSKSSSFEDLQKLAKRDPLAVLEKLGYESEDDYALIGRAAYTRTKEGKADPRSKPIAEQSARERALAAELAELRKTTEELRNEFKTRDTKAQSQAFIEQYLDAAVKAIPETPTLIGKLHAKAPAKARQALLDIGARLERENDNETPSHAEVIAEYERVRRAELEEQGVDVDAILKPVAAKAPTATPSKTLDVTSVNGTRPLSGAATRAERIAAVSAGLKKLDAQQ